MKKIVLLILFVFSMGIMSGQSVLHYDFTSSLNEINGNGPSLSVLGNNGIYVEDTLEEIGSATKFVYRFEENSGVQFDNTAAGNFLGESYTIEIYFVFDYLNSWKRVVDWKNRTTDYGAYVFNGQLNFYPFIYSSEAPVVAEEYTYYVITRDSSTTQTLIYTDAVVQIEITDNGGDALLNEDNVLNFFHDDLIVAGEASSGAVAMLKLYNYALDSNAIQKNYEDLGSHVFAINEPSDRDVSFILYPNPAKDLLRIKFAEKNVSDIEIFITDIIGNVIINKIVQVYPNETASIDISHLSDGIYFVRSLSGNKSITQKLVVRH